MWIRREKSLPEIARRNRQEIIDSRVSRRDLLKLGLLSGAGYLIAKEGLSNRAYADDAIRSPPTRPFIQPLAIPGVQEPVGALNPVPQVDPLAGEGRTRPHQLLTRFPPQKLYEVHQNEFQFSFHPDLPLNTIWGFDGHFPGKTYHARYGEPVLVRNVNDLPQDHKGFGIPQVSTHLHNGHTPSESDGFPCDFYPQVLGTTGQFYDQHHPNAYAGFLQFPPNGDLREAMSTLWYHDHRVGFTAQNVYKGLAGFYLLFNEFDTGDETTGFRLPSGEFDVPMIFLDKTFDPNGQLFFDLFNLDGVLGDKFEVNGKIQPFFQVHPRRYRFRWLDGGPSRFYQLFLTDLDNPSRVISFEQIANDGNLGVDFDLVGGKQISKSSTVSSVRLGVAERADVVIDFSQFAPGSSVYIENRLEQTDGRGPTGKVLRAGTGNLILRLDVVLPPVDDNSRALGPNEHYSFYELPTPTAAELANAHKRSWRFERGDGQWQINGRFFDCDKAGALIPEGTGEIWTLQNSSGGWQHPIHIHQEEFLILSRNGRTPSNVERGRKDVVRLEFDDEVRVFKRFRDTLGQHPMHCHNTVHEDHAMMVRWDIVPA
jgi:FtsP/CotA-like multicopper oxidase with cupredoxin domain